MQNLDQQINPQQLILRNLPESLYHGSPNLGICELRVGGTSLGPGVYLTDDPKIAIAYAKKRANLRYKENLIDFHASQRSGGAPFLYKVSLNRVLDIVDLRRNDIARLFLESFVKEEFTKKEIVRDKIIAILNSASPAKSLQEVTIQVGDCFVEHLKTLGRDGLIAFDIGEPPEVPEHDSYLIFDPKNVSVESSVFATWF